MIRPGALCVVRHAAIAVEVPHGRTGTLTGTLPQRIRPEHGFRTVPLREGDVVLVIDVPEDDGTASTLVETLSTSGLRCWIDPYFLDVEPGDTE